MAVQLHFPGSIRVVGGNATGFIQSSYSWQLSVVIFFFLSSFLLYDFTFIGPITEQDIGRMVLANLTKT
jgi:hypothetical protein